MADDTSTIYDLAVAAGLAAFLPVALPLIIYAKLRDNKDNGSTIE